MPVTARVVSDERMAARGVLAACDVAAERHRAAALDCAHHLQLVEAHMAAVGLAPSGTVLAEALSRCQGKNATFHDLSGCQAAATAVRHVVIAAARSARCVWA